jgi:hypothetical protein
VKRFEEGRRRLRARRVTRRRLRGRARARRLMRAGPPRRPAAWILALVGAAGVIAAAVLAGPWLVENAGDPQLDLVGGDTGSGARGGPIAAAQISLGPLAGHPQDPPRLRRRNPIPTPSGVKAAREFARGREGLVSFAVVDSRGMRGLDAGRRFVSASVVKVMLLAAELDRLDAEGLPLDDGTREVLHAMITYSDNAAADTIYNRVGDAGLFAVARRAGLRDFTVSGYWANAQISARDMARLMDRLDRVIVGPYADFGAGLMTAIVDYQRWGIPTVVPDGWLVRFKGGWRGTSRGQLVHQIARLEQVHAGRGTKCPGSGRSGGEAAADGCRELALAILTDGQPTQTYGIETVRGVAERLLTRK